MPDEQIAGDVIRFSYQAPERAFAVAILQSESGDSFTAVGPLGHLCEGQHVLLTGHWTHHSSFGRQFQVKHFLVEDPKTLVGLERYLASGAIAGMGPTSARRIVAAFGLETLQILNTAPHRLQEVPGIGPKRQKQIIEQWQRDVVGREVHAMLRGYGVGDAISRRIVETYGEDALVVITEHTYRLATEVRGVGFRTADRIALERGVALDDPSRAEAALVHLLHTAASAEGHCFMPRETLCARAVDLSIPPQGAEHAVDQLVRIGMLCEDAHGVYLPTMLAHELRVARRLRRLLEHHHPPVSVDMSTVEATVGLALGSGQQQAVRHALSSGLSVITGGPGTGKTTLVRALLHAAGQNQETWMLAAPTGRAARRLTETTGQSASTIHRLLEFNGRTRRFDRDFANPLACDGVLIDEASMMDIRLMDSLLSALPPGCRLVLVGDVDQLPSVGPGRVLADVIQSGVLPVFRLTSVYRQSQHSGIVRNAHRINDGRRPCSGEQDSPTARDFFIIHRNQALAARDTLLNVIAQRLPKLGFNPKSDVQVLTPMHNGPLGTVALNSALQQLLNPTGAVFKRGDRMFRIGDRVIQVRNDHDNEIFNGDTGTVIAVGDKSIDVAFENCRVSLQGERINDLQLAYAISVHKSQGSEYPAVVMVLHDAHRMMLRRNLLYTAVTRARRFCCVVTSPTALRRAVSQIEQSQRHTALVQRLQAENV